MTDPKYGAAYTLSGVKILKTTDGANWFEIVTNITDGTSSRCFLEYQDKLYMAVINDAASVVEPSLIYSSKDPELTGWFGWIYDLENKWRRA